jgi:hypothetical protein
MSREYGGHGTDETFVQYYGQESLRDERTFEVWEQVGDNINVDPKETEYEEVDFLSGSG